VGGRLSIDSAPERGTTVRAELPALRRTSEGAVSEPPLSEPLDR
jgi:hypothetical protein